MLFVICLLAGLMNCATPDAPAMDASFATETQQASSVIEGRLWLPPDVSDRRTPNTP